MRLVWIILAFAAIGGAMAHLRLQQGRLRARTYRLEARRYEVRRKLWDQQMRLGEQVAWRKMDARGRELALELSRPGESADDERIARTDP